MLELKNISFNAADAAGKKEILKDISFQLEDNTFVAVTGPNGGGKPSLAKVIAGIENRLPARSFTTGKTSPDFPSQNARSLESAMHSSSLSVSRGSRSLI